MSEIKPRRIRYEPHPDPAKKGEKIKALSLDFKVIEEHWNIYELEDGTRVRARVTVNRFKKALDPRTSEPIYKNNSGEPIYGVDVGIELTFDIPEELLKPEIGGE
ncbi:MAG: hypothetical protein HY687_03265 [Chloroflexi bacterium]|nr:hypothetical protein [Chloroflexota bacterium]